MDTLVLLAHFVDTQQRGGHRYIIHGISWSLLAMCCFWFSLAWYRSFIKRKFHRNWETSLVLCIVFLLFGMDKVFDVLSIWYNLEELNTLLEGAAGLLFVTWLSSHFRTKQLPVFLDHDDIDEIDIKQHEKSYHSDRITNMLNIRNDEDKPNEN